MSVSQRGYVALSQGAVGRSISWPAGTAAGDVAVLVLTDSDGRAPASGPSGWTFGRRYVWWRVLTAADVAAALSAPAVVVGVVVWAGAGVPSSSTRQSSVSVPAGGAAFFAGVEWWGNNPGGATGRLGAVLTLSAIDVAVGMWGYTAAAAGVSGVSGASPDASWSGLVFPALAGPAVPTLVSPTSGQQVASAAAVALQWVHNSTVGGVQTAYRAQVRAVGAGSWSYVAADGTLNASVQTVTSAAGSASINAGLLTAGASHEWSVSTQEAGVWSAAAAVGTFVPVASPSVSSVSVSSPLGTLAPAVSWSAAAGVGGLTAFQVLVTLSGGSPDAPLYDSGVQVGAGSAWTVPARSDWTNGGSYKAWVRVAQAGGLWSPWVSGSFTVSWTAPAAPSSVTVAQGSPPVVTIGSVPSGHGVGVQWSSDAGATWTTLATLAAGAAGSRSLAVPLAPFGAGVLFRASSILTSGGVDLVSAWTTSAPFTSADEAAYLVSASDPAEYVRVSISSDGGRSVIQSVAVWSPLGGARVRVDRTVPQGESGTTTLQTETDADTQTLLSWLTGDAFWLRWNPETQAGVKLGMAPTLMAVADTPARERIAQIPIGWRRITFPWVEQ